MAARVALNRIRGVFAGSGSAGMNQKPICDAIIALSGKETPRVVYLGTATYDHPGPQSKQTEHFTSAGCDVRAVQVALGGADAAGARREVAEADVCVVSGGNTLYAMDRWQSTGLDVALRDAAERGCVLCGGSAGAICWFDAGHSDSMDPASYRQAMLARMNGGPVGDEASAAGTDAKWDYVRVGCLGFLPGLVCPHSDTVQSNGVPRDIDFDKMLLRHTGETGICIDHWAALVVADGGYRVLSLEGMPGSVLPDGSFSPERKGAPGVWRKRVEDGEVKRERVAEKGAVQDLLEEPRAITPDPRLDGARAENPFEK
eukprot:Hpha_TRINITY_DN17242_c0_g1::TRINITY_DN17242_c0_g1_i1::g.17903::m.17903